MPRNFAVWRP